MRALGDVVGAFKSRVVHAYIAQVKAERWPRFPGKIWHRNYYERVIRTPAELAKLPLQEALRYNGWGIPFRYEQAGGAVTLRSTGFDGLPNTADDQVKIVTPNL